MEILFLLILIGVGVAAFYKPYCEICGKQPCIATRCPVCKKKRGCGKWGETCECYIKTGPLNCGIGGTLDGGAGGFGDDCE